MNFPSKLPFTWDFPGDFPAMFDDTEGYHFGFSGFARGLHVVLTSLLAHAAVALNFPIVIALVRGTQGSAALDMGREK